MDIKTHKVPTEGTLLKTPIQRITRKSSFLRRLEKNQQVEAPIVSDKVRRLFNK